MEIIILKSGAYKDIIGKIDLIARYITKQEEGAALSGQEPGGWIDNSEAADMLGISKRTLQRLRNRGDIGYSLLGGKCYYRFSDIDKALKKRLVRCNPQAIADFRKNFILCARQE